MAEIAKSGKPSLASLLLEASHKITGLIVGEDVSEGDACYIKAADGKIWRSNGVAVAAAAKVRGWALMAGKVSQNDAVTLVFNCSIRYGAALVPGTDYYLSGTVVGGIADAPSTGGTAPIAFAIDATRIYAMQSRY